MATFEASLFGCFRHCCSCFFAVFIPLGSCCLQGVAVSKAMEENCFPSCILATLTCCVGGGINRGKIRYKYSIEGMSIEDCCIMCFCFPCASAQIYREVLARDG